MYDDQLIVITGAAGMIGSCCVRHLNNKGFNNLLLVDEIRQTDKWKNLVNKQYVDLISPQELFKWLEGKDREIEAFIHLGACSDTMATDGNYVMQNNFRYTIDLARYALSNGHRFIYASSAATYGDGSLGFIDDHEQLNQLKPMNLYAFSKYSVDNWFKQQQALNQVVGLKYFNVYGPNENHKERMASMIYKMVPIIQESGCIRLFKSSEPAKFGDGEQVRDFIYVKDAARMTCDFLSNEATGIFNIGSGVPTTWNALAQAVFHAMEKPVKIEYIEMPRELRGQYQNYTLADMTKYRAQVSDLQGLSSIEDGVKDYVQQYLLKGQRW